MECHQSASIIALDSLIFFFFFIVKIIYLRYLLKFGKNIQKKSAVLTGTRQGSSRHFSALHGIKQLDWYVIPLCIKS